MQSKSHFLAHFIPGILLGAVVGLAFGSLLVASQIPSLKLQGEPEEEPRENDAATVSMLSVVERDDPTGLVTERDPATGLTFTYRSGQFSTDPRVFFVSCSAFEGFPEREPDIRAILQAEALAEESGASLQVTLANINNISSDLLTASKLEINGHTYYKYVGGDAGAGSYWTSRHYFTQEGSQCLDLQWVEHYTNCSVYDDQTECEAVSATTKADADAVEQSLRFEE